MIELLVVLFVVGLLLALLMPAVMSARSASRRAVCLSNLRQIGFGVQTYVDFQGVNGVFPWASIVPSVTPDQPSIVDVLDQYMEHSREVYRCPSDITYFERERTSYEYPATRLAGRRRVDLLVSRRTGRQRASQDVWLLYDFEPFHGRENQPRSRNVVYLDGHADAF